MQILVNYPILQFCFEQQRNLCVQLIFQYLQSLTEHLHLSCTHLLHTLLNFPFSFNIPVILSYTNTFRENAFRRPLVQDTKPFLAPLIPTQSIKRSVIKPGQSNLIELTKKFCQLNAIKCSVIEQFNNRTQSNIIEHLNNQKHKPVSSGLKQSVAVK